MLKLRFYKSPKIDNRIPITFEKNKLKYMKKIIFGLVLGIFTSAVFAQTEAYTEFVKKASFLQENKKMGGFNCFLCEKEQERYYEMRDGDYIFEVLTVKRENGNVKSFFVNYPKDFMNMEIVPNDTEAPTCWVFAKPYQQTYIVMYQEFVVFLSNDPAVDPNFFIRGWFKVGPLTAKEKLKANLEQMEKKIKPPFTKEDIAADCKASVDAKISANANNKANAETKAAEHKAKYSIKGKKVTKIEIVNTYPKDFFVGSKFTFGIVATLADGSQIKTKELGGEGNMEDYNVVITGDHIKNYDGYEVGSNLKNNKGDYILIEANSIHHTDLKKVSAKMVLTYNQPLKFNYSGRGSNIQGDNAENIRVEIKQVKHSETGETLLEYRIYNSKGLDKTVRVQPTQVLELTANGGNSGYTSLSNGKNYRGGDAGNITLYIDPTVGDNYRFEYSNRGGKGGSDSRYLPGGDGRDGSFTKKVQAIP